MTLVSFIDERPPRPEDGRTDRWTTVSTSSTASTLPTTGLRMSARTNFTPSSWNRGGTRSTPTTLSSSGSAASARAVLAPRSLETPVTSATRPIRHPLRVLRAWPWAPDYDAGKISRGRGLLTEAAALHACLLEQFAVLLLGHALAALFDNRAHVSPFTGYEIRQAPDAQA